MISLFCGKRPLFHLCDLLTKCVAPFSFVYAHG
ncbi:MAG: hypothetical protein ACI9CE_002513, partial [Flavobacterium sp.]